MTYGSYLKNLREKANFSQDFVAKIINVSRPTVVQIEKAQRELTLSEARKLAALFSLSIEQFLAKTQPGTDQPSHEAETKKNTEPDTIRISIPKFRKNKFKAVLLYVLQKVGAKPNIGETALYKLLYFIDFDFYEKFEQHLTGAKYRHNHFGPTPIEFTSLVTEMENKGELEKVRSSYFQYEQKKYLPRKEADLNILSAKELAHIDEVLNRLSDKSAQELSNYSHSDIPWKIHKPGETLDYESVFYRDQEHSVRNYDDEL